MGHPVALSLRLEVIALLKSAADKADEWQAAAEAEWTPHADAYNNGEGLITTKNQHAYAELRLSRAVKGSIRLQSEYLLGGD